MADQSDVESVLVALASAAIYPAGTQADSVVGRMVRLYRGWPNQASLDADLDAGHVNVTIFPDPGATQNTTRYPAEYQATIPAVPQLAAVVAGATVTLSGSAAPGQLVGVLTDNTTVVHRTADNETPDLVAAVLADLMRPHRLALAAGPVLTIPGAALLIARVVADQPARLETRRQRQAFRITCWCPDPDSRDDVAAALDVALSRQPFIALPDGTAGHLRFVSTSVRDGGQHAHLYRRDLLYSVEYATTFTTSLPAMLFGDATLAPNGGPVAQSLFG